MKKTLEIIRSAYSNGLHGEAAQYKMAPADRSGIADLDFKKLQPRLAAVLLLVYPLEGEAHMVFTKRHEYEGVHGGQISFPGGEIEDSDNNLRDTALRETEEELSVDRKKIEIIGELSDLYISPSNFLVTPYLGYSLNTPEFLPDEYEVASVLQLSLSDIIHKEAIESKIRISDNSYLKVPAYIHKGNIIWGATAMMLSEFISMIRETSS
ncbi:MAG: CoA pyrophosphatase [Chitinophagales bacterium]|nr:CoA pyrophosphatase [Chitinophagales bacterium]